MNNGLILFSKCPVIRFLPSLPWENFHKNWHVNTGLMRPLVTWCFTILRFRNMFSAKFHEILMSGSLEISATLLLTLWFVQRLVLVCMHHALVLPLHVQRITVVRSSLIKVKSYDHCCWGSRFVSVLMLIRVSIRNHRAWANCAQPP